MSTDESVRMTYSFRKYGRQQTAISSTSEVDYNMCDPTIGATHVVTELKYGFNAFMLFEMEKSESESKQEIEGDLEIVLKSMPISGGASIDVADSERDVKSRLTFKFHGDAVVDPPPSSYDDAVEVYQKLPEYSLDNERVLSYSLAPISEFCGELEQILLDIANDNIERVVDMLEDFEHVEKVLRRLLSTKLALDFQRYRGVLLDLERRFENARGGFTSSLQTLLPRIRTNEADESELTNLLTEYATSPFEKEHFLGLLATRQKEIETTEFIIYHKDLPSNKFIDLDHTGDMSKCIIGHDYSVVSMC